MANNFTINALPREQMGKGASRRLRGNDMIPAILYGAGKTPVSITLPHITFVKALENEAFYSHILTLSLNGKEEKVILRDIQRHPYRPKILHVDLQRVNAAEKLSMHIPLHFIGAEVSPGVKLKGGIVSHLLAEIEIRCLPSDLPEYVEVDLSHMELDETIHLSGLKLPKNVEIIGLIKGSTNDKPVVSVHMPRAVVEEVPVAPVSAEVETIAEAKAKEAAAEEAKAEGTAPAGKEAKEKSK